MAYLCVEGCSYEQACPDGQAWIDGRPTEGTYGWELTTAQAIADAEARGKAFAEALVVQLRADNAVLRADFARVVYLGNRASPLSTDERDELNTLLKKAYQMIRSPKNTDGECPKSK